MQLPSNWTIIKRRIEDIAFSRMLRPAPCNESEDVGTYPYEVLTIEYPEARRNGFVSPEITKHTADFVVVGDRYFQVGKSETGSHKDRKVWLSVSLPPELDPTPPPREWDMVVSTDAITGVQHLWDPRVHNIHTPHKIRVREVRP